MIEPGLSPELTSDLNGVDAGRLPPGLLVAGAMDRPVMRAAERDGEFVAGFAAERPRLQVAKMMRIGLFAAADETCLLGNVAKVLPVAIATRCSDREDALVDALRLTSVSAFGGGNHLGPGNLRHRRIIVRGCGRLGRGELRQPPLKGVLYELGIGCGEAVLGAERLTGPSRGTISRRDVPKLGQQLLAQRGRLVGIEGDR